MISIIVPVYKAEAFLHRCVSSILNQTYRDLELILVDDGSPDRSGDICDEFARQDARVRVIHKENGGVSTARNAGLDAAAGEYITFVDSDDYIDEDMYERMMEKVREYHCDVVLCDCVKEFENGRNLYTHEIRGGYYDAEQLRQEYYPHLLMMENVEYPATISSCTMLWKSSLNTEKMRYEPGIRFSEDLLFGAKLLRNASSFYYMKGEPFYHYVMNPASATHTYVPDKWQDYQRLHAKIRAEFAQDAAFDFRYQTDLCLLFFLFNTVGELYGAALPHGEKRKKIQKILDCEEVRAMFGRLSVCSLPISQKQKLVTLIYKYRIGVGAYLSYCEGKNK